MDRNPLLLREYFKEASILRDGMFETTGPFDGSVDRCITFCASLRYLKIALSNPSVNCVIVPDELADFALSSDKGVMSHSAPREQFFDLHNDLAKISLALYGPAAIHPDAIVSPGAMVAPGASIEGGAEVEALAYIGPGTTIGRGTYVGEGALIGVCGHFENYNSGRRQRVLHSGRVVVGENTQVLAGAIIQRDIYALDTYIGNDAVVGPGVQMGHGSCLGDGSVVAGGTVVAGYTKIGKKVWIGPGSVIANNLLVEDTARAEIGSVVVKSISSGKRVSGNFATSHRVTLRNWAKNERD